MNKLKKVFAKSRKLGWRPKTAILVSAAIYITAYTHCRHRGELVHFKSWSSHNHHQVRAVAADPRMVFVNAILVSTNAAGEPELDAADRYMDEQFSRLERRRMTLAVVFAPHRWVETGVWYLVDYRRPASHHDL